MIISNAGQIHQSTITSLSTLWNLIISHFLQLTISCNIRCNIFANNVCSPVYQMLLLYIAQKQSKCNRPALTIGTVMPSSLCDILGDKTVACLMWSVSLGYAFLHQLRWSFRGIWFCSISFCSNIAMETEMWKWHLWV